MCCFFSSRRRHTRCALVTGVQTCALPICAAAARIDAPADDPPTQPAELDGQRAVELARRVDILEPELLQKHRRVDPDQIERQAARLVGVEVERRRMQDQLAARERPAPALEADAIGTGGTHVYTHVTNAQLV